MLLSYIFNQLTQGELSQLSVAGTDVIGIQLTDYEKVVPHINLGLIELYKRFSLKEHKLTIQEYESIDTYILDDDYAVSNTGSAEPIKYIVDSVDDPFVTSDFLKFVLVEDEEGTELPINDYNDETSIFTPTYNSLKLPSPTDTGVLTVTYRAAPEIIVVDDTLNPEQYDVKLPMHLLEALIFYIASRAYSVLDMGESNMSDKFFIKYEAACKRVVDLGLISSDDTTNMKLEDNGWV